MPIREVNGKFLVLDHSGVEVGHAFSRGKAEQIHAKKVGTAKETPRKAPPSNPSGSRAASHRIAGGGRTGVSRLISGGQTGADQGGVLAGRDMGLATGGWVPKGWKTELGNQRELLAPLGLLEHKASSYPPRTKQNVIDSDATLVFGDEGSNGSRLTVNTARAVGRPSFVVPWRAGSPIPTAYVAPFKAWLKANKVVTLNVAGNRESRQPGIEKAVRVFLQRALT